MASTPRKLYRVRETAIHLNRKTGERTTFYPGRDVYDGDHPLVKANPGLFEEVEVLSAPTPKVEAATAAPGEKRDAGTPAT